MKKFILVPAGMVIAAGLFLLIGAHTSEGSLWLPTAEIVDAPVQKVSQVVVEARVVPMRQAALAFPQSGTVHQVLVTEGENVTVGQMMIGLDDAQQQASVAQAEADLARAKARLKELQSGPRPEEIDLAQADLEAAQAQLGILRQSARPEEIISAETSSLAAQAALHNLLEKPDEDEAVIAAAQLRQAEIRLQQAQWAYDEVAYGTDVAGSPEAAALEQATLEYEEAVATYHLAVRGPTDAEIQAAKAQLAQAEAALSLLEQGATDTEMAAALADIHRAQAQKDLVTAGNRPETVAAAQADLAAAEARLAQTQASCSQIQLRAPFSGTVARLDVYTGEMVTAGETVAFLADFSDWRIETEDLTEIDVVDVQPGTQVTIKVDAIPSLEIAGHVSQVRPLGEDRYGDITYTAQIVPSQKDARLRWNMTAAVSISPSATDGIARHSNSSQ